MRAELRAAVELAHGICAAAADMQCECKGYYRCNGCERHIAERAEYARDVLAQVLLEDAGDYVRCSSCGGLGVEYPLGPTIGENPPCSACDGKGRHFT